MQTNGLPEAVEIVDGQVLLSVNGLPLEAVQEIDIVQTAFRIVQRLIRRRMPVGAELDSVLLAHRSSHSTVFTSNRPSLMMIVTTPTSRLPFTRSAILTFHSPV